MNVNVMMDGRVYIRVPSDCGAALIHDGYDLYRSGVNKDEMVLIKKGGHWSLDDALWLFVGNVSYLNKERFKHFTSVKDIADWVDRNKRLPWGWRGIVRYKKWTRIPEKGTSLVVSDGVHVMRYWNKKGVELTTAKTLSTHDKTNG